MRPLVLVLALGLTACASGGGGGGIPTPFVKPADEIRVNRIEVAIARGDMQALLAVLETRATDRCSDVTVPARRFSAESCQTIQKGMSTAAELDTKLVAALRNPTVEVDWQEVVRVIKLLIQIAMKFAYVPEVPLFFS